MNEDLLYRLWGKTNERDKVYEESNWSYHPAVCHMIDVGYVAREWLRLSPWILDRFCALAPAIDRDELRTMIITLVAIHDLGKVHSAFQSKSEKGWAHGYGSAGRSRITDCSGFDHGRFTAVIMNELLVDELVSWETWEIAIEMVAAHHGRLYEAAETGTTGGRGITSIERKLALETIALLSELFEAPDPVPDAPESAAFAMLLAGFTSVCDWFGSNSQVFRFDPSIIDRESARGYLDRLGSENLAMQQLRDAGLLGSYQKHPFEYADLFPALPGLRPLQETSRQISFGTLPGAAMVIVEAPMGMGKTEIALYLAAQGIGAGTADGIYFALPTQASSNALLGRITAFAERIKAPDSSISLVLAHGGKRFNTDYRDLQKKSWKLQQQFERTIANSFVDDTISVPSEVIAPGWLQSTKRALLASIGVGTIDQAMLGAISVKHAFVRLFGLAGKVVVFDEIHAYDSYMNVVILHLLRWLNALGVKVILLSATLPRSLRSELLGTYGYQSPVDDSIAENDPYPQIIHLDRSGIATVYLTESGSSAVAQSINVRAIEIANDDRTATGARLALELASRGGCIAWIRNTVKEAQQAWDLLRQDTGDARVEILHARFTRTDRNSIEEELVEILGRSAEDRRPRRMIVIATQVIEQSVDIDFDAMISDLAPGDLLLQRAGRLWRHERPVEERQGHAEPILHVLLPDADEQKDLQFRPSSYVYEPEILSRTAQLIREMPEWHMPDACRTIVARLYDRTESEWTAERLDVDPEKLAQARTRQEALLQTMAGHARRILMPQVKHYPPRMQDSFSDDDKGDSVALTTRHGGASATAVLLEIADDQIRFMGKPDSMIAPLPDPEDTPAILKLEEAVALSTVSFPWYERMQPHELPEPAAAFEKWWQKRHPYDHKVFTVVDGEGNFDHPQFSGHYRREANGKAREGLVIEKKRGAIESHSMKYEEL